MGHNIRYEDYKLDVNKQKVQAHWDEHVRHVDYGEGASGLPMPIRWVDSLFESYDDAQRYIEEQDKRIWYNCMAVKYKEHPRSKPNKKVNDLSDQIQRTRDSLAKIIKDANIQNRTSEFIGCPQCGSSLKRTLLKTQNCPLCGSDLRNKTNLERIENAKARLSELEKKRVIAQTELDKKQKPEIRWLVKIEYHT